MTLIERVAGFLTGHRIQLPEAALVGAEPNSAERLWSGDLTQWAKSLPPGSTAHLIRVRLPDPPGAAEHRAFIHKSTRPFYLGPLTRQFPGAPIETILFEAGKIRFILGRIDESFPGKLDSIDFEGEEPDRARWMEAVKVSTLKRRTFLIPIFVPDRSRWQRVTRVAIKTAESLKAGWQRTAPTGSAWEKQYDPGVDLSTLFIPIP